MPLCDSEAERAFRVRGPRMLCPARGDLIFTFLNLHISYSSRMKQSSQFHQSSSLFEKCLKTFLRYGYISKILQRKKVHCRNVWSTAGIEFTKPSNFLLDPVQNQCCEIILPYTKFQIVQIPNKISELHLKISCNSYWIILCHRFHIHRFYFSEELFIVALLMFLPLCCSTSVVTHFK